MLVDLRNSYIRFSEVFVGGGDHVIAVQISFGKR
jgi:hypothetical protein